MADLDTELAQRLSRLAAAVPVSSGRLDPVHRGAVEARHRVRMAWVTPLAFVVVAVLLMTAVGVGPFAGLGNRSLSASAEPTTPQTERPAATLPAIPPPSAEPTASAAGQAVSAVDAAGPYALELSADRAVYHASDAIQVTGTFTYSGSNPIAVQAFVPWDFSIAEPVYGMDISEYIQAICTHEVLQPGERIPHAFIKGGGVRGTDPEASFKLGYLGDPVLRLPPGTWHIRASSSLTEGTCGDKTILLSTEIVIQVLPDP